jgi:hypothetical protein
MAEPPWLTSEVGVAAALRQAAALLHGGLQRPWRTLLATAGLACALGAFLALRHRDYAPSFVLRVEEADRQTNVSTPALKRQLAEYVRQAVFTSEPLLALMQKHRLYPTLMRNNPRAALDTFKADIDIEVYQNYFVEERRSGAAPRSARLTVSFHAKDPNLALAVTRDLGALIVEREQARRRDLAKDSAARADQARDLLVQAVQRRSSEILAKQRALSQAPAVNAPSQVELVGLMGSLEALERQASEAERRAAAAGLGAALERRGIGLYFEVVDDGSLPGRASRIRAEISMVSAAALFSLPLFAMAVGALSCKRGNA